MINIIKYSSIRIIFPSIKVFENLVAFFNLGLLYYNAAKLNNKDSLNNLGDIYTNGQGIEQNYTKAIEYYVKSEKLNNMYAINNHKVLYANVLNKITRKRLNILSEQVNLATQIHYTT